MKAPASSAPGSSITDCLGSGCQTGNRCAVISTTLAKGVWCRVPSRIRGILSGGASLRIAGSSPTARFPLEIVEMIVANLICETNSLFASCYSWYLATVPHLRQGRCLAPRVPKGPAARSILHRTIPTLGRPHLLYDPLDSQEEPPDDMSLVPSFAIHCGAN